MIRWTSPKPISNALAMCVVPAMQERDLYEITEDNFSNIVITMFNQNILMLDGIHIKDVPSEWLSQVWYDIWDLVGFTVSY